MLKYIYLKLVLSPTNPKFIIQDLYEVKNFFFFDDKIKQSYICKIGTNQNQFRSKTFFTAQNIFKQDV